MRAAIYARVSSVAQRDSQTIENQLRVLPAFVKQQGWTLAGTYIDDGKSAGTGKLDQRDGFARLVADAERRMFDVVVVVDVDRLTRTNSMEERAVILGPFQRLGIDIVTPSGGRLDLRSFLGEFYVTMQALVAAEERRKILYRTQQGKERALAEGRKPAGKTPYGYHYDRETGAWSINEPAAAVVREIYERIAAGESCVEVANSLRDRDARPAPPHVGWSSAQVYRIVRKGTQTGEWLANSKRRVVIKLPPIVTKAQWRAAEQAMAVGKSRGLRRTRHVYLLEGLGVCGECGGPMGIRTAHKMRSGNLRPAAYRCLARYTKGCRLPFHLCEEVDARTWAVVEATIMDPEIVAEIERRLAADTANTRSWADDAARYEARISRLTNAESALLARFSRGAVSEAALDVELARIAKERGLLEDQLETARRAGAVQVAESPRAVVERLRGLALSKRPEDRRDAVRAIVEAYGANFLSNGRVQIAMTIEAPGTTSLVRHSASRRQHVVRRLKVA